MTSDHAIWGKRFLPILSFSLRRKTRSALFAVPLWAGVLGLAFAIVGGTGLVYLGLRHLRDARLLAAQRQLEQRMEMANLALSKELATLEDKLGDATRNRAMAEHHLADLSSQTGLLRGLLYTAQAKLDALDRAKSALSHEKGAIQRQLAISQEKASSKQDRIAALTQALGSTEKQLHQARAERATLSVRLALLESEEQKQMRHEAAYRASVARSAQELRRAIAERDALKARLAEYGQRLSQRRAAAPRRQVAALSSGSSAPRAAARSARGRSGSGVGALGEVERVLASTGVDVGRLFASFGVTRGEGGPFVPAPKGGKLVGQLDAKQLAALRRVAKTLPLTLPLNHYRFTSPFGMRRDPFNGRPAFHPGVDLAAPYGSPLYATAPGVVVYAGWMSGYGKTIDIDDGHGIMTRYGHLHRYTVLVGQHVAAGTQIGYEGSTGRSTGPHVIYEVRVNGKPQDPMKFVHLARLIPAAVR